MVFVGNTDHTVPYMLKHSDLFDPLPEKFHDSAFLDRLHSYIPGWEVDVIRGEMFSSGYGFVVDYLAEILRSLRSHDFSEILYALTSAGNNNGSAFAGLSANTPFYNTLLGIAMWLGRFGVIVPVLAIAGALAAKKRLPVTAGTMPTHGPLFVGLVVGTVLLVGLLNYVPALALGPVVEHFMLWSK